VSVFKGRDLDVFYVSSAYLLLYKEFDIANKGKGSHRENHGTRGSPSRNGEKHTQSSPGRSSGKPSRGGNR